MTILVTGTNGMIGSRLVKSLNEAGYTVIGIDRVGEEIHSEKFTLLKTDLDNLSKLQEIIRDYNVDRIIHLAALAHTRKGVKVSWNEYKHVNVDCAKNVFTSAGDKPLLFVSTVDVYGFFDGKKPVSKETEIHPISNYGKSKALAEEECKTLTHYSIFRLSPVYSDDIKRDIQKRYYLKYPNIAYKIGRGSEFEILNIDYAIKTIVNWCNTEPLNDINILKDHCLMKTTDYIKTERAIGNAKIVIWIPSSL